MMTRQEIVTELKLYHQRLQDLAKGRPGSDPAEVADALDEFARAIPLNDAVAYAAGAARLHQVIAAVEMLALEQRGNPAGLAQELHSVATMLRARDKRPAAA